MLLWRGHGACPRRVAEQHGAEPGQVAGLGQVPDRAPAGFLERQSDVFQPEQRGVEGLGEPAGPSSVTGQK